MLFKREQLTEELNLESQLCFCWKYSAVSTRILYLLIGTVQIAITSKLDCRWGSITHTHKHTYINYIGTSDWQMADKGNLRWDTMHLHRRQRDVYFTPPIHTSPDVLTWNTERKVRDALDWAIPFSFSGYYPPRPMYSGVGPRFGLNHAHKVHYHQATP